MKIKKTIAYKLIATFFLALACMGETFTLKRNVPRMNWNEDFADIWRE